MRISTKGRYALRLMVELALNYNSGLMPLKVIAEKQDLSDKYLEQLITQLSRAGYVHSVRGAQGGYKLAIAPEKITVGMVLRTMEGSLAPVACLDSNDICERASSCATISVWRKLNTAINDVVDNITLADLVEEKRHAVNDFVI